MADLEKINDLDQRITGVWAEIHHLLSKKKSLGGSIDEMEQSAIDLVQHLLSRKNFELHKLKREKMNLEHCYNVILVGDYYEKNGSIIEAYPFNVEITSLIDCALRDGTSLSKSIESHSELTALLKKRFEAKFVNGKFTVAYIIQLR
jgi:hypothetical protein